MGTVITMAGRGRRARVSAKLDSIAVMMKFVVLAVVPISSGGVAVAA